MNMVEIICKKRDGFELTREEIEYFVEGYTEGNIPDYQASALLMAIYFNGMTDEEIFSITRAMKVSGDIIDLSAIEGIKVDKHSTGGVGDKTTLIVGPITAACGVPVAKMSGRGLGHTGGTVDKLESIEGFKVALDSADFINQVNTIGISVIGQTAKVARADKKLYALRDVTGTVESLGLIASSIMSKKLASGANAILLDVKCGDGAFMKDIEGAEALADMMCRIGADDGVPTAAAITDMSQPLGNAVGNALEVIEAIDTLKCKGPRDITELSIALAGNMIYLGGKADSPEDGIAKAKEALESGAALSKFREFIEAQGGNGNVTDDYSLFAQAEFKADLVADESFEGYVAEIKAGTIGNASQHLGAGREKKEDDIDMAAGIYLHKKVGDKVEAGDVLATLYTNDEAKLEKAIEEAISAYTISTDPVEVPVLIKKYVGIK